MVCSVVTSDKDVTVPLSVSVFDWQAYDQKTSPRHSIRTAHVHQGQSSPRESKKHTDTKKTWALFFKGKQEEVWGPEEVFPRLSSSQVLPKFG